MPSPSISHPIVNSNHQPYLYILSFMLTLSIV